MEPLGSIGRVQARTASCELSIKHRRSDRTSPPDRPTIIGADSNCNANLAHSSVRSSRCRRRRSIDCCSLRLHARLDAAECGTARRTRDSCRPADNREQRQRERSICRSGASIDYRLATSGKRRRAQVSKAAGGDARACTNTAARWQRKSCGIRAASAAAREHSRLPVSRLRRNTQSERASERDREGRGSGTEKASSPPCISLANAVALGSARAFEEAMPVHSFE